MKRYFRVYFVDIDEYEIETHPSAESEYTPDPQRATLYNTSEHSHKLATANERGALIMWLPEDQQLLLNNAQSLLDRLPRATLTAGAQTDPLEHIAARLRSVAAALDAAAEQMPGTWLDARHNDPPTYETVLLVLEGTRELALGYLSATRRYVAYHRPDPVYVWMWCAIPSIPDSIKEVQLP